MAFVKLDCGILDSTLWVDRIGKDLFITALLMAEPKELRDEEEQIKVKSLERTGFVVPPGWYGFVPAAGVGIIRRAGIDDINAGLEALERLGEPEQDSRTPDFDGRRMVRVDGGFLILNYDKYRQKDHTAAERSKRYRQRKASQSEGNDTVTSRSVTRDASHRTRSVPQAEAEAYAEVEERERKGASPPSSLESGVEKFLNACGVEYVSGAIGSEVMRDAYDRSVLFLNASNLDKLCRHAAAWRAKRKSDEKTKGLSFRPVSAPVAFNAIDDILATDPEQASTGRRRETTFAP